MVLLLLLFDVVAVVVAKKIPGNNFFSADVVFGRHGSKRKTTSTQFEDFLGQDSIQKPYSCKSPNYIGNFYSASIRNAFNVKS